MLLGFPEKTHDLKGIAEEGLEAEINVGILKRTLKINRDGPNYS